MAPRNRRVCLFGTYEDSPLYGHNRAVRAALAGAGFEITECRPSRRRSVGWAARRAGGGTLGGTVRAVTREWLSLARQRRILRDADLILVPYPPHADVFLARLLRPKTTPLVIDAFLGLYETYVTDRRLFAPGSLRARFIRRWESAALGGADLVLMDTAEQAEMVAESYALGRDRLVAIPVGVDEALWHSTPLPRDSSSFVVAFWGTFIPLHGVDTIVRAAVLLQDRNPRIRFRLIGDGQDADRVAAVLDELRPANLEWERSLRPIEDLQRLAAGASCVLGIFGDSAKAGAVIPYKIHQALATGRPVVTREASLWHRDPDLQTPVVTVPPADPQALANALDRLAGDPDRCRQQAQAARAFFDRHLSARVLGEILGDALATLERRP